MFDSKMLIVVLLIALVIFGTKRLRSIGSDLGAAVKGFKSAMNEAKTKKPPSSSSKTRTRILPRSAATRESDVKVPPKTNA